MKKQPEKKVNTKKEESKSKKNTKEKENITKNSTLETNLINTSNINSNIFVEEKIDKEDSLLTDKLNNINKIEITPDKRKKLLKDVLKVSITEDGNIEMFDAQETQTKVSNAQEMLRAALSGSYSIDKLNSYSKTVLELENKKSKQNGHLEQREQTKLGNNKHLLKIQQEVKDFLDLLAVNSFTSDEAAAILLPFADPTFDTTFKELFGLNKHNDLLISLLNNLLSFKISEEIISVETVVGNLETGNFSYKKGLSGLTSEVDVLCKTQDGKTIAIEMQRTKQDYFLARMEYYMSKLIAGQLIEKDTSNHHKAIDKTYILVLAKENLFTGHHALYDALRELKGFTYFDKEIEIDTGTKNIDNKTVDKGTQTAITYNTKLIIDPKNVYEIDVTPVILQTSQEFPDNKMYWKFFELSKFKEHEHSKNLNEGSDLKYQWLEFIIECGSQLSEPDRHKLIMQGYNIMKTLQRDNLLKAKYWNEQAAQFEHELHIKDKEKEAFEKGRIKEGIKGEIQKTKEFINKKRELEEKYKDNKELVDEISKIFKPNYKHLVKLPKEKFDVSNIKLFLNEDNWDNESQLAGECMKEICPDD